MIFRKRNYKRGRIKFTFWVLGFVKRSSDRILLFPVLNRKKSTMDYFINKFIQKDTIVYTDEWAAYKWMDQDESGYIYGSVNHSENYINPGIAF